jgi:dihydroxy-acid dehydratase
VGKHQAGNYSDAELAILERVACPSAGACGGQFTANTMACVSEAIGLALPNSSGAPAPYEPRRIWHGQRRGGDDLIEKNIRARDIVTRKSLENAARIVACTGGSTNAGLHLPAIAHEAGIDFDLFDVCDIFRDTPYFVDLKPGGKYVAKDLYEVGGVPVVMKELRKMGLIHEDCMTATGRTMGEELDIDQREADGRVIYPAATPITKTGGVVGLKGNLAPEGAIVKVAGMSRGRAGLYRPRPRVRMRGRRLRGRESARLQRGRGDRHPQRRPRRRPRHARDAGHHRRRSAARAWARRWR